MTASTGYLVGCGDSTDGSGNGTASSAIRVEVLSVEALRRIDTFEPARDVFLTVRVRVSADDSLPTLVSVTPVQFSLVLRDRSVIQASPSSVALNGACAGDQALLAGGALSCSVSFDVFQSAAFEAVAFVDPTTGRTVQGPTPVQVAPDAPEVGLGSLPAAELEAFCSAFRDLRFARRECGDRFAIVEGGEEACRFDPPQLPLVTCNPEVGESPTFTYDASRCSPIEYLNCTGALGQDPCAFRTDDACSCATEVVVPDLLTACFF